MTAPAVQDLETVLGAAVTFDAPLAPLTTYRIGGPAAALVEPASRDEIARVLAFARERQVPWLAIGLGSNLLVSDAGFPGIVLRLGKRLAHCGALDREETAWRVGSGLPTPRLARLTAKKGRAGVHRLIGVPGTVGGGVYMNAGAHGQEFRDVVREVTIVTAEGEVATRSGTSIPWRYRSSGLGTVVVVETVLGLTPEDPARLRTEIGQHLKWRKAGTPFNEPCCGSVFRNPAAPPVPPAEGQGGRAAAARPRTAGQLIDAADMKGFRVGGAQVSPLHANYIVNTGGATADDVRRVIDAVQARVADAFGVTLELEVQLVGG